MIISQTEGKIDGFQYMDPQIGLEVMVQGVRDQEFPFNRVQAPSRTIDLSPYINKKVRITVEIIDDETEDRYAP